MLLFVALKSRMKTSGYDGLFAFPEETHLKVEEEKKEAALWEARLGHMVARSASGSPWAQLAPRSVRARGLHSFN